MDVSRITGIGRGLQQRLRTIFDGPLEADATPLEIVQAVLDDVERHVEPAGRGRRVFPYADVVVHVQAAEADVARMDAVLADLSAQVAARLQEVSCTPVEGLAVTHVVCAEPPEAWTPGQRFAVTYRRVARPEASPVTPDVPPVAAPCLSLAVLKGRVAEGALEFHGGTIAIGRDADPVSATAGTRRNRVAFLDDGDPVNETVGRAHARVRFVPELGHYRLTDEGSRNGTSVVRDGEVITVPGRDPRGVRLRHGDEIRVGRAILTVTLDGA